MNSQPRKKKTLRGIEKNKQKKTQTQNGFNKLLRIL